MKTKIFSIFILAVFSLSLVSGVFATDNCIIPAKEEKQINIKLNENFKIILKSNRSTGYGWSYNYNSEYIQLIDENYIPDTHDPWIVGSGGKSIFEFKAIKQGESDITLKYLRPWENCIPTQEIVYHVKITE
ncbi:MAG: protease inhibitor I42 family protein [Methanobacterium sp.]